MQHHTRRLIRIHLKKRFEDMDDKFHRCVIVVQQQHFIKAWLLCFRTRARSKANPRAAAIFIVIVLRHKYLHKAKIG